MMIKKLFFFLFISCFLILVPDKSFAAITTNSCLGVQPTIIHPGETATYTVRSTEVGFPENYTFKFSRISPTAQLIESDPVQINAGDTFVRTLAPPSGGRYRAYLEQSGSERCSTTVDVIDVSPPNSDPAFLGVFPPTPTVGQQIEIRFEVTSTINLSEYYLLMDNSESRFSLERTSETEVRMTSASLPAGAHRIRLLHNELPTSRQIGDAISLRVIDPNQTTTCCNIGFTYDPFSRQCKNNTNPSNLVATNCTTGAYCEIASNVCVNQNGGTSGAGRLSLRNACDPTAPVTAPNACSRGAGLSTGCATNQLSTAIGCISTEPQALISGLLGLAAGISGAIALLLMIFGSLRMITSAGNPETLKSGQEQFTSAIIGLLFIIFSVLLLQIIGVDILNIPGLTKN